MQEITFNDGKVVEDESETLEFKTASKGIPSSTWETYSAFANSFGGTVLLGVRDDGSVEGVPHAEQRVQEIWNSLNNPQIVNVNVLRSDDVAIIGCGDKQIIRMVVPRADRFIRPVYYRRMESGTFKRNGEGDYRCTMPEIALMQRDQSSSSYDGTVLEDTSFDDIDMDTLRAYRNEMASQNPDHMWNRVSDTEFLKKIGAVGHSTQQLTVAGLLMFGKEEVISSIYPRFKLDYLEYPLKNTVWSYRRVTGDGLWVGNIYNFFSLVRGRIGSDVAQPMELDDSMHRVMYTDTHRAVRECLLNSLVHADYLGNLVVKIEKYPDSIVLVNSGLFRIPVELATRGGESDPRNALMAKMFALIGMSERAGIGLNYVFDTWAKEFGTSPRITEDIGLQRTRVELELRKNVTFSNTEGEILEVVRKNPRISMQSISDVLGISRPSVVNHMGALKAKGAIRRVGGTRGYWEVVDPSPDVS